VCSVGSAGLLCAHQFHMVSGQPRSITSTARHSLNELWAQTGVLDSCACTQLCIVSQGQSCHLLVTVLMCCMICPWSPGLPRAHPASYVQPRSIKSTFCHSLNEPHAVLGVQDSRACTQSHIGQWFICLSHGSPGLLRAHPVSNG
jgi:hypothetical protein